MTKILIIGMLILFLCSGALSATTINIPGEYPTIQQGINASQDADTVLVQQGTYFENINFNGKNITVGSTFLTNLDTSYISQTIIDGNQSGSVVTFESGEDTTAILCGFTIQNGIAGDGGGIYCYESDPRLRYLRIINNAATASYGEGGGIYSYYSNVTIENSIISNNNASFGGGGIHCCYSSNILLNNVIISQNTSHIYGAGINSNSYADLIIFDSEISHNYLTGMGIGYGGGIFIKNGDLLLNNIYIHGNTASKQGGGLCFGYSGNIQLTDVVIKSNSSGRDGGGIYGKYTDFNLLNVIIHDNTSENGGGLYLRELNSVLQNVEFIGNSASKEGGGIYLEETTSHLTNAKIANNSAANLGGGIYLEESSITYGEDKSTIYLNEISSNKGSGNDIFAENCDTISVIVDTFTVINPTDHYASPLNNFLFEIEYGLLDSLINSDFYVSIDGSNTNSGTTQDQPVKTINYALSRIYTDSLNHHTIFVEPGIYSHLTNGENFPLNWNSFVSLEGSGQDSTILDADSLSTVIRLTDVSSVNISDITIKNGNSQGIYCVNSDLNVNNVSFLYNSSNDWGSPYGGAIYCYNSILNIDNSNFSYNSARYGGAIYSANSSDIIIKNSNFFNNHGVYYGALLISSTNFHIENVLIENCSGQKGGGMNMWSSSGMLSDVILKGNTAEEGGAIYFSSSICDFENVVINNNTSVNGGGIYMQDSDIYLSHTTVKNNYAENNYGGIYCYDSSISFNTINLSNIYLNTANYKGSGKDIFAYLCDPISVIVDTFTVINPTDYYASPIDQYTFSIIHGKQDSLVNADLYIAEDGDNSNSGLSPDVPLKTIDCALSRIYADSTVQHTIFVAPGIYSSSTNGETFPLEMSSYVSITGSNPDEVILDADSLSCVLHFTNVSHSLIENVTIQNGVAQEGGGVRIYYSDPTIRNVVLRNNHANEGGAIYSSGDSHPIIDKVVIHHCSSSGDGGAIWCSEITLNNSLFYKNTVGDYGIILCEDSSELSQIINITMTNNTGLALQANYGYLEIMNSILWNDSYTEIWGYYTNDIHVSYSDIQGGYSGIGNMNTYPLFEDPLNDDYHLRWTNFPYNDITKSPCIDKGNPDTTYYDPDGTRNDMGWAAFFQQPYGQIAGQVSLNGILGNVEEVTISADTMSTHPNDEGLYTLPIWPGCYDVTASYDRYQDSIVTNINTLAWQTTSGINFELQPIHVGPVWHISVTGSDSTGTGSSQYPFATIQLGITIASDNDTILIHPGTYYENINYNNKALTVCSLFLTTQDTMYIPQTIIDGDSSGGVVKMTNSDSQLQVLSGLWIQNGCTFSGAGIYCENSNSVLDNLIVKYNTATSDGGGIVIIYSDANINHVRLIGNCAQKGGGLLTYYSNSEINDLEIKNNTATFGGGIYHNHSHVTHFNNDIMNNTSSEYGGGFFSLFSDIDIRNSSIEYNTADSLGGALYSHSSDIDIMNSLIADNSASIGGGIYSMNTNQNIYNSTITKNSNIGICDYNLSGINVANSILWLNTPQEIDIQDNATFEAQYTDIFGGYSGTGNIDEDPLFINPDNLNFRLSGTSPCINTGTPDTTGLHLPPWDLDGNPRIYDSRIDMGAYEWQGVAVDDTIHNYNIVTLHQNFPNPFKTSTQISFSLPHPEKVKIQIYNLKGQLVETLLDENKQAGIHSLEWNAEKASSGIYFIKLSTKEVSKIQKVILIK